MKRRLAAAAQTYIGKREANQDRMLAEVFTAEDGTESGLFCVADGMGGTAEGERAAELAIAGAAEWWREFLKSPTGGLAALFEKINREIVAYAKQQKTSTGTTLSLLFIHGGEYQIAHSGDSRIYYAEKRLFGVKGKQLTQDHTSKKNRLTSCLGVFEEPLVFEAWGKIKKPGAFLLCTDGVYRVTEQKFLMEIIAKKEAPEAAEALITAARERGARDNATVVVVKA